MRICTGKLMLVAGTIGLLLGSPISAQETGESLFKAKCAMCHGADATGKTADGAGA